MFNTNIDKDIKVFIAVKNSEATKILLDNIDPSNKQYHNLVRTIIKYLQMNTVNKDNNLPLLP